MLRTPFRTHPITGLVLAAAALFAAGLAAQTAPPKPDAPKPAGITGKWTMTLEMSMGTANPALVFKQDGEKLTGTYTGRYGTFEFKGTLKDRHIEFGFKMSTDGGDSELSFSGEVAADGQSMKGTGEIEGLGDVTWTAARDKDGTGFTPA